VVFRLPLRDLLLVALVLLLLLVKDSSTLVLVSGKAFLTRGVSLQALTEYLFKELPKAGLLQVFRRLELVFVLQQGVVVLLDFVVVLVKDLVPLVLASPLPVSLVLSAMPRMATTKLSARPTWIRPCHR
jgi:hypothetical protein